MLKMKSPAETPENPVLGKQSIRYILISGGIKSQQHPAHAQPKEQPGSIPEYPNDKNHCIAAINRQ